MSLKIINSKLQPHFSWANELTDYGQDRFNTLRPGKMAAIFQTTFSNAFFLNENVLISIKISLMFVPKGQINNIPALV